MDNSVEVKREMASREHVNYSSRFDCVFIHIPKAAGTSISRVLGLHTSSHLTCEEYIATRFFQSFPELPVLAAVRHPFSRFLSLYHYARTPVSFYHDNLNPSNAVYGAHSDYHTLSNASIDDAIDLLFADRLVHAKRWNHWRPQYFWINCSCREIAARMQIIKLENLECGLKDALGDGGWSVPHLNQSAGSSQYDVLTEIQRGKLFTYYREDFLSCGYS